MKEDGGPAFPVIIPIGRDGKAIWEEAGLGMTLRDYFATAATMGLLAHNCDHFKERDLWEDGVAKRAYLIADAMLKERSKE